AGKRKSCAVGYGILCQLVKSPNTDKSQIGFQDAAHAPCTRIRPARKPDQAAPRPSPEDASDLRTTASSSSARIGLLNTRVNSSIAVASADLPVSPVTNTTGTGLPTRLRTAVTTPTPVSPPRRWKSLTMTSGALAWACSSASLLELA